MKRKAVVKVYDEPKPVPFYVTDIRKALKGNAKVAKSLKDDKKAKNTQRTVNILNAFIKGRSIWTVECGKIDTPEFVKAINSALEYMRKNAENVHNKKFKDWLYDNLEADMSFDLFVANPKLIINF